MLTSSHEPQAAQRRLAAGAGAPEIAGKRPARDRGSRPREARESHTLGPARDGRRRAAFVVVRASVGNSTALLARTAGEPAPRSQRRRALPGRVVLLAMRRCRRIRRSSCFRSGAALSTVADDTLEFVPRGEETLGPRVAAARRPRQPSACLLEDWRPAIDKHFVVSLGERGGCLEQRRGSALAAP